MLVRKAKISDVRALQQILAHYAREGKLLARSLSELYAHLRDMFVCVEPQKGQVVGCCALHIVWENLAEIRSAAVLEGFQGQGMGRQLVEACIAEARELEIARLFVLTIETGFFEHFGFHIVDKNVCPIKSGRIAFTVPNIPNVTRRPWCSTCLDTDHFPLSSTRSSKGVFHIKCLVFCYEKFLAVRTNAI